VRAPAGRLSFTLLLAAAAGVGIGGCASRKPVVVTEMPGFIVERVDHGAAALLGSASAAERRSAPAGFWEALSGLDFEAAARHAVAAHLAGDPVGEQQRLLVEALRLAVAGHDEDADSALAATIAVSDDPLVRRAARIALTATLQAKGDWTALATLSRGARTPAAGSTVAADSVAAASARYAARDSAGRDSAAAAALGPDGKASVEAWARAFHAAPRARYDFPAQPVVLPLALSTSGVPTVPVRINGQTYHFWLDTGSSLTILSDRVAAAAGVAPLGADTLEAVTATGQVRARPALVPALALGELTIVNASAMLVGDDQLTLGVEGDSARLHVDGIIGFDAIRRMDLELDYGRSRATIRRPRSPDAGAERARNLFWLGYPIVRVTGADGTPLHFALDTGADESYAAIPLLQKTGVRTVLAERRSVRGFGKALSVRGRIIPRLRLRLRDTQIRLERVFVYVTQYPTIFVLDGTLGSDAGAGGVVRIDMTNGIFAVGKARP